MFLKRLGITLLLLALLAAVALALWFTWLQRFLVYTAEDGAILDFSVPAQFADGVEALPPETAPSVPLYYNDGDETIEVSTELTQLIGYYIDEEALKDIPAIREELRLLEAGTPILMDVKSIYGNFFYSSKVSARRNSDLNTAEVDALITYLTSSGYYVIARAPALRDYYYGLNNVPHGLPTAGGYLWMDDDYCYWLNPASQGTQTYLIQIINELKSLGFDEVVFRDFYFPDTNSIVFKGDKLQTLADTAKLLVDTCTTEQFAVSFTGRTAAFPLPEGRSRLYLEDVAAADAEATAVKTGFADPQIRLVFLTDVHDTRFDAYSVLRPLSAAH
jgi:hypothetical protein